VSRPVNVALLNDYDVVVAGLAALLDPYADQVSVLDISTGGPTRERPLDVVLYDTYGRPGLDFERIAEIVRQPNVCHMAVYTFDFHDRLIDEALARGVAGYLWKGLGVAALVDALLSVAAGDIVVSEPRSMTDPLRVPEMRWPMRNRGLTARESETVALLIQGLHNREIADTMYVSVDTVKTHLRNVFRKLGVRNRAAAVAAALADPDFTRRRRDLIPLAGET
jgi:DNA-binding NarL/FixJ family response regulator